MVLEITSVLNGSMVLAVVVQQVAVVCLQCRAVLDKQTGKYGEQVATAQALVRVADVSTQVLQAVVHILQKA